MRPTAPFPTLSFVFVALALGCSETKAPVEAGPTDPVALVGVIAIPDNAVMSGTKSWVDAATKRLYLTDVSNAGVDVIDASSHVFQGRVPGFVGATTVNNGGTPTTNGAGPNSITFSGNNRAWVSDGNSQVQVVDLNTLHIIATVSTAIPACDGGTDTTRYCGRTNELTYDPEDQIIFVQNPTPLALAAPHGALDTYGTFISAVPPYTVLGTIIFTGATGAGQEAPLWDPGQHRILTAVAGQLSGTAPNQVVASPQYVAVVNPKTRTMENKYVIDCQKITGTVALGINDPALGPNGHIVIPACGKPVIMDAATGDIIKVIAEVGGGNETWYNPGDGRFYVTGADTATGVNSLGVIDAKTSTWLQNIPAVGATNPTAFAENNHIFAVVPVTAAMVTDPTTDNTACARFDVKGKGCIAVFTHVTVADSGDRR
jgi:hypothetical protein